MSDRDLGAAAAATAAMDMLPADPEPDTEIHLSFSPTRPATADDSARADLLLVRIREALRKYADVRVAAADGFEELPAAEGKHTIHHLSNWAWARGEARGFDPARPTSLLYREGSDGTLALFGAMYTAPANASVQDLDARIPISLARWHHHVNWCTPQAGGGDQWLTTRDGLPVYGPRSPVASRAACDSARGVFYPEIFGWMVHVTLVGSDDPQIVWTGSLPNAAADSGEPHEVADRGHPVQVALAPPASAESSAHATPAPMTPTPVAPAAASPQPHPDAAPTLVEASDRTPAAVPVPHPPDRAPPIAQTHPRITQPPAPDLAANTPANGSGEPDHISSSFMSGHRTIAYDRVSPAGGGTHPAILLLHGDGGLPPQNDRFQEFAAALANRQYVVEIVHYFDRTGTIVSDPTERLVHFREWEGTVRDAITDVMHAPGVDSTRIGLFGTGLGGSLALSVAAGDKRVRAVTEYEGNLPVWAVATVRRMPAVFIGESDADSPVAVLDANRVRSVCEATNAPVDLEVYAAPNRRGRGNGVKDLRQRTFAFLEKYLKGA